MSKKDLRNKVRQKKAEKARNRFIFITLAAAAVLAGAILLASNSHRQTQSRTEFNRDIYQEVYVDFLSPMYPSFQVSTIDISGVRVYSFFRPPTGEVTDEELLQLMQATEVALKIMETHPSFTTNNVTLTFTRPLEHGLVIFDRTADAPEVILTLPEFTMQPEETWVQTEAGLRNEGDRPLSVLNLAADTDPPFSNQLVGNLKIILQAVCLGYARDDLSNDPACNIYSINAAAGLAGIDQETARRVIESYGLTSIGYLTGVSDLQYHFDAEVYYLYANNPYYHP